MTPVKIKVRSADPIEWYERDGWDWYYLGAFATGIISAIVGLIVIVALSFIISGNADAFISSFECVADDVNGDGVVNITDLSVLAARINQQ